MSDGLQFDEETTRKVEALYETSSVVERRRTVINKMKLRKGERVVDIGSGPGFISKEIAEQVGPSGKVRGYDISDAMIQMANKRCQDNSWATFEKADATLLTAPDSSFDVAVSVQVFEYIADVDTALKEMCRVLKPGGRAFIVSTDWNSVAWNSSNAGLMSKVLSDFEAHCKYTALPLTLASKLKGAGLSVTDRYVLPQFEPVYDQDAYSVQIIPIIQSFVEGNGQVSKEDADNWAAGIHETGKAGDYFFCLNQFLFCAQRPA